MADTFNNDLRVREQEAGSNSGTWGGLLNTTISNLASAFGQGSEAIPNASTHTITLADGAADEARSMYLKCTGGGQACTVTFAPNTISKTWIISNETSYTLTFSQGSGANVAVPAGAVKMIVTDGAGSGAAVTDALSGLAANVSNAVLSGTTTAQTLDISGAVTAAGLTVSNSSLQVKLEEADGTNNPRLVTYFDSSGTHLQHTWSSNASNLIFEVGGSEGSGTERMRIDASGNVGIGSASPYSALTIDTANGILNIANGNTSGGTKIQAWAATPANGYLAIEGYDKEYMRIDSSGNVGIGTSSVTNALGWASVAQVGGANPALSLKNTSNVQWDISNFGGTFNIYNGSANRLKIDSSGNVGIGTGSPSAKLAIVGTTKVGEGAASNTSKLMVNTASGTAAGIQLFQDSVESWIIDNPASSTGLTFSNSGTERMRIDGSGNVSVSSSAGLVENAIGVFMLPAGELRVKDSTEDGTAQISTYNNNVTSDAQQFFVGNNLADVDIGNKRGALKFFANSTTERMRIDTSGNLTVGNTNAGAAGLSLVNNYNLSFSEGSNLSYANVFRQASSAAAVMGSGYKQTDTLNKMASSHTAEWARTAISAGYGAIKFYADAAATVSVGTDITPTERMRVDSTGKVLIGTTGHSFGERLTVNNNGNAYTAHLFAGSGATAPLIVRNANGASGTRSQIIFYYDASAVGSITSTSSATALVTSSDQRLKDNIVDADDAGNKIDAMQVRKFDWKADGSHQEYGFVAQELEPVFGHAVHTAEDEMQTKGVDYASLVPVLVKEIQSLRARVQQLENS